MNIKPSQALVRAMLNSHSVLGLTLAALLYIVCVTGTFSVFYPFYERWEQPRVMEYERIEPAALNVAVREVLSRTAEAPDHLYIGLPTDDIPRVSVSADEAGYFVNPDGSLGAAVNHEWTHFLVELHYALTLPGVFGLSVVGIIGVMMVAMIVSGLLAHPNIFKDAFSFRMGGSRRLKQVDLHNRLSVWTAPFQFVIALTGAMIGLSQLLVFVFANTFYEGNLERAGASLFNPEPEPSHIAEPLLDVGTVLANFQSEYPDLKPLGITVHEPATTAQVMEIGALVPRRLVWAEFFQYDKSGELQHRAGWSNGPVGTQIYASTYRLHFGHFAGLPLKLAYIALGVIMCIVVASGVNIWLLRRRQAHRPAVQLEKLWVGMVWGVPLSVAASALLYMSFYVNAAAVYWLSLLSVLVLSWHSPDTGRLSLMLRFAMAGVSLSVLSLHVARFGEAAFSPAAILVNSMWLIVSLVVVFWYVMFERHKGFTREGVETGAAG